jgi:transglutaminase-like putative cysteine protease
MIYRVAHKTSYDYSESVSISQHVLRLHPRSTPRQEVLDCSIEIEPKPTAISSYHDRYGNSVTYAAIEGGHQELIVHASSRVALRALPPVHLAASPEWEYVRGLCAADATAEAVEASEFIHDSPYISTRPEYADYAAESFEHGCPILEGAVGLMERIHKDFKFDASATTIATPLREVFQNRRGVCQDFAHLQIALLRSIGLPARYVSGYLETDPPPGKPRLVGADASHAWVSVFCPGTGWVDLDPTNNILPTLRHITIGWGRDYADATPIRGVILGGGRHKLKVAVDVLREEEVPSASTSPD